MTKKLQFVGLSLALLFAPLLMITPTAEAASPFSGSISDACEGANLGGSGNCDKKAQEKKINDVIATVINILSVIVGIVAVIMLIISGFRFITSSGDSNTVASARNGVIYAIVGLVLVAFAQVIVRYVVLKL